MISEFFAWLSLQEPMGIPSVVALIVVFIIHPKLYLCVWIGVVSYLVWDKGGIQATQEFMMECQIVQDENNGRLTEICGRIGGWFICWILFLLAVANVRIRSLLRDMSDKLDDHWPY